MNKIKGNHYQPPNLKAKERVKNYNYTPKANIEEIRAKLKETREAKMQMTQARTN
jgi:hypothetical protein